MLSMGPGDYATLGGSVLPMDKTSSHSQQVRIYILLAKVFFNEKTVAT